MIRTGDWIKQGWELVKPDLGMHVLIVLVVGLVGSATGGILMGPVICGYLWVLLQKLRNPAYKPQIGDVFNKGFEVFVPALVGFLIIAVLANVGMLACFVGMIVVQALTYFALPLIVDQRMDFWPAIMASYERTKADWMSWSVFWLVLMLLNLAGALVCGLGVLVTAPIMYAAVAIAYQETFLGGGQVVPAAPASIPPTPPDAPPAA